MSPCLEQTVILEANGIYKSYGAIEVLKDVNLTVQTGTTHAVIGPNGAGKTTLFKVLSGELFADKGTVHFEGRDVSDIYGYARVRRGIGRTFQVAKVFSEYSVIDNMLLAVESQHTRKEKNITANLRVGREKAMLDESADLLDKVGLSGRMQDRAGILAYGERKRLELAMTLALKPRMLMLDEPMAGMSPGDRVGAISLLNRISEELNMSILLTEHDMSVVFALAHHVTVLNYGEMIATGTPDEIRSSSLVRDTYLGY